VQISQIQTENHAATKASAAFKIASTLSPAVESVVGRESDTSRVATGLQSVKRVQRSERHRIYRDGSSNTAEDERKSYDIFLEHRCPCWFNMAGTLPRPTSSRGDVGYLNSTILGCSN